jgi:hypothetical protein
MDKLNFGHGVTNWDQGNFLYGNSVNGSDFDALDAFAAALFCAAKATTAPLILFPNLPKPPSLLRNVKFCIQYPARKIDRPSRKISPV